MPTYDYICDACGHEFEAFESIKADPQTVCPECKRSQAPPQDRPRGRDPVQGLGLLPDRLPERFVQESRQGREISSEGAGASKADGGAKADSGKASTGTSAPSSSPPASSASSSGSTNGKV